MATLSRWLISGTSPRVRGKPPHVGQRLVQFRYIPACAGEAFFEAGPSGSFMVHPRVCGGSALDGKRIKLPRGTSPRVRGKRSASFVTVPSLRYIPACAGEATGWQAACKA